MVSVCPSVNSNKNNEKDEHLNNSNSVTLRDVFVTNANTIKCYIANSYRQTKDIWGKRPRFYLSSSRQLGYLSSYRSRGDVVYQFTRMNNVPFSVYLSRLNLISLVCNDFLTIFIVTLAIWVLLFLLGKTSIVCWKQSSLTRTDCRCTRFK